MEQKLTQTLMSSLSVQTKVRCFFIKMYKTMDNIQKYLHDFGQIKELFTKIINMSDFHIQNLLNIKFNIWKFFILKFPPKSLFLP